MVAAFFTTILFAFSAISGRRAAGLLGGTDAHFWRLLFAGGLLASYAHVWGGGLEGLGLDAFLVSGAIGFGLGDMSLYQALPRIGSRLSTMMVLCLSAPMAALVEWVWLGHGMSWRELGSGLMILAGVSLALAPSENPHLPWPQLRAGMAFGLAAAVCQALGAVLSRLAFQLGTRAGENLDGITAAYQRILAGILVTAVLLLVIKRREIGHLWKSRELRVGHAAASGRGQSWRAAWAWVLLNGLAGPALGVSCYQWALKTSATGVVLPIVALTPLVIMPLSWFFEGERPTRRSLLGGVIAVAGAVILAAR